MIGLTLFVAGSKIYVNMDIYFTVKDPKLEMPMISSLAPENLILFFKEEMF